MREREVAADEAGKHPRELGEVAILRVYRDGRHYDVDSLPVLQGGDTIVFVTANVPG